MNLYPHLYGFFIILYAEISLIKLSVGTFLDNPHFTQTSKTHEIP